MKLCYIFTGQGTQKQGMLKTIIDRYSCVKEVFEVASEYAKIDVKKMCMDGSNEELKRTINTQIAVTAMNMSFYKILQEDGARPDICLGHSLGQLSAAAASGVYCLEDLFKIVIKRAQLMDSSIDNGVLCSIIGTGIDVVKNVCGKINCSGENISIALHNAKNQIVIGGKEEYIDEFSKEIKKHQRVILKQLNVSNAFHTPLMRFMESDFAIYLKKIQFNELRVPMLLNCYGDYAKDSEDVINDLIAQCCHTVKWYECLRRLGSEEGVIAVEVGYGETMSKMLRNVNKNILCFPTSKYDSYSKVLEYINNN